MTRSKKSFDILFLLYWLYFGVGFYLEQILFSLFNRQLVLFLLGFFYAFVVLYFFLASRRYIFYSLNVYHLLLFVLILLIVFGSYVFHEPTQIYIEKGLSNLILVFMGLFAGFLLKPDAFFLKHLKRLSILIIVVNFVNYLRTIFSGLSLSGNSMYYVSAVLPSFLFLITILFLNKKRFLFCVFFLASLIYSLLLGSRGGIVTVLVAVIVLSIIWAKQNRRLSAFIFLLVPFVLIAVFWNTVVERLALLIGTFHGSSRVIDMLINGDFAIDLNRQALLETAIYNLCTNSPVFGFGVFGDRVICGTYVHNIIIEFLVQFGFAFGIVFLVIIFYRIIKNLLFVNNYYHLSIFITLLCVGFVKLMASGTYIDSIFFWILLGYLFRFLPADRKEKEYVQARQ